MRILVEGTKGGKKTRHVWDLFDRYDAATGQRSMSRTTGFTASVMTRMLLDGRFSRPGVHPPEIPALEPGFVDEMLRELEARGVRYTVRTEQEG
jgi:saccharopine dehydrogenase-like NADP-dependent oxidoreductase